MLTTLKALLKSIYSYSSSYINHYVYSLVNKTTATFVRLFTNNAAAMGDWFNNFLLKFEGYTDQNLKTDDFDQVSQMELDILKFQEFLIKVMEGNITLLTHEMAQLFLQTCTTLGLGAGIIIFIYYYRKGYFSPTQISEIIEDSSN